MGEEGRWQVIDSSGLSITIVLGTYVTLEEMRQPDIS